MKAKKVYEFVQKKSLKNTTGPIGLKYKLQQNAKQFIDEIIKCNSEFEYKKEDFDYDIDSNTLYYNGHYSFMNYCGKLDYFLFNFKTKKPIYFVISNLPTFKGFKSNFWNTKNGMLKLISNSNLIDLPKTIYLNSVEIMFSYNINWDNTNLNIIKNEIERKSIFSDENKSKITIKYTNLVDFKKLTNNIDYINGDLDLSENEKLTTLPDKLIVDGNFKLFDDEKLLNLPNPLIVKEELDIRICYNITKSLDKYNIKAKEILT